MSKTIITAVMAISLSLSSQAFAGAGHSHSHGVAEPASKVQLIQQATNVKQQLIGSKQISSEWGVAKGSAPQKRSTSNGDAWVVVFSNPKAADQSKSKLFVFVDEFGNPIGANHTGEL